MTSLAKILSERVGAVFEAQGLPAELGAVRVSDRPDLCQFQCNGAMAAAKKAGKNPRELAGVIVEALKNDADIAKVELAGPGFINIDLTEAAIADFTALQAQDERFGAQAYPKDTIILDYGGPNIAKPMHVGHLRASIIGDSLRRIYLFAGYKALGDVHMGDWGTPMGQIISELEIRGILDKPLSMDDLEEIYPIASKACKEDEARMERARAATAKLQDGDPTYRKVWQQFIDVSIAGMKANFDALGVHFDLWKGEASVHDLIAPMVEALKAKGLAQEDDGAVVVPVALEGDSKEIPPLILYKRDGAVMYGTTDLATIVDRMREYSPAPAKMIYVVDQRQSLHFEQVFRAARLGGIAPAEAVELIHAGFGTMNGTDGKPFKTRAGGVMKLEDLIANGVEKARQRLDEANLSAEIGLEEREDIAHKVAIAAIKFADLQNNRIADYVFDLDRMTSFEGKTGPYLLYQAVRIKSLLRKAEAQGVGLSEAQENSQCEGGVAAKIIIQEADRALALMMAEFPDHFDLALRNNTPHVLCDYAYRLAQAFSSFYSNCHILSEPDAAIRTSRLMLCDMTARQLELVLNLLGIAVPDRM
ncbi:MAG: arginine--tRNA ligase [Alphaproteobacteria bacterium]